MVMVMSYLAIVAGGFLIILIIVIIVVIIRKNKSPKEMAPEPTKISMDSPPTYPTDPVEIRRMEHATPGTQPSFFLLSRCRNE